MTAGVRSAANSPGGHVTRAVNFEADEASHETFVPLGMTFLQPLVLICGK